MAKDDYFVIVYQVLKYLYEQLKNGQPLEVDKLTAQYYRVNDRYWYYILENMLEQGYVKGYRSVLTKDGQVFLGLECTVITPKGIEYLFDNSLMEKVKRTLKGIKDMTPML